MEKKGHRQASATVVGKIARRTCIENIQYVLTLKAIMRMMKELRIKVAYWKAWMHKKIANNLRQGLPEESFASLSCCLYMDM